MDQLTHIFTDGGASRNGKIDCVASWAYHIMPEGIQASGLVPTEKGVVSASNNRGELYAIYSALLYLKNNVNKKVVIVSDSEYSIKCIEVWGPTWIKNPSKLTEKKNLDIIIPIIQLVKDLRKFSDIKFQHTKSHLREPNNHNSYEWFIWYGNNIVDKLCTEVLYTL